MQINENLNNLKTYLYQKEEDKNDILSYLTQISNKRKYMSINNNQYMFSPKIFNKRNRMSLKKR